MAITYTFQFSTVFPMSYIIHVYSNDDLENVTVSDVRGANKKILPPHE